MDKLGLLAFFLSIPFSIIANLLTPLVKNWFASFSQKRLEQRIKKLEKELEGFNNRVFSIEIVRLFRYMFISIMLLAFGITIGFAVEPLNDSQTRVYRGIVTACLWLAGYIAAIGAMKATNQIGESYGKYLEKSIESLRRKLEKKSLAAKSN